MIGLRLNGSVDMRWFTDDQPVLARRVVRRKATGRTRQLGDVASIPANEVRVGDRIGLPVDPEQPGTAGRFVQALGNPQAIVKGGSVEDGFGKCEHVAILGRVRDLTSFAEDQILWFLLGAYLGDGYRGSDRNDVSYCVGAADGVLADRIRTAATAMGVAFHEDHDGGKTNIKVRVRSRHLHMICGAFGDGADKKSIPVQLMGLEAELLDALIDGYRATDGSSQGLRPQPRTTGFLQARWKIASVSLQLLRDVQRLLLRRGTFASIHHCWPGGPQTIMGRVVQTKPRWELNVRLDPKKRTCFEFGDGVVWVRVRDAVQRDNSMQEAA